MIKKETGLRQATENRRAPLSPLIVLMDARVRKDGYWRISGAGVESVSGEFWSGLLEDLRDLPV